jgi:hypothetical protein
MEMTLEREKGGVMLKDMRQRGRTALNQIPEVYLPAVVRWLELLVATKDHPDVEPEELWLLATGELKKMNNEIENATPIDDWREYLAGWQS